MKRRKPRHRTVTARFDEPTRLNGVKAYVDDGQIEFLYQNEPVTPAEVHVDLSYERPKGPKTLTRTSAAGSRWPSHPHDTLLNADLIYWVDTNSKYVDGQWIHATCAVLGEPVQRTLNRTVIKYQVAHGFEFRGNVAKPERLAWCEVIERLRRNPNRLLNWNVYLVVDSDQAAHSAINAHTTTVWNDYRLPPRFQLVYASADVGMDLPLNSVMAQCDRTATRLLDQILRHDPTGSGVVERSLVGGIPLRRWDPVD